MTSEEFIRDLEKNIYCRLLPSSVHGVGVFAIRDIPKGTDPFEGCRPILWNFIPLTKVTDNADIADGAKKLAQDLYGIENGVMHYPNHGLNDVNISYFINHADAPNVDVVEFDEEIGFIANRDIHEGEELYADYRTYIEK